MEGEGKGKVCVTGGTGFLASWLIHRLLQHGYSVNTTIRPSPEGERDVNYLTHLPGASERLHIFTAQLDKPESFNTAIEGCVGVFHVAHPMDFDGQESEEENTRKAVQGTLGILQACLDSKTVKRVVYTSSAATVVFNDKGQEIVDEGSWSNIDLIRRLDNFMTVYAITKTLTEKACIEFAQTHGLELVTVVPTWIHGPFVCPSIPSSVKASMAMFFGDTEIFNNQMSIPFVHTDDVAEAHIFVFEHPDAKGRYICSALEIEVEKLYEFLSTRYPHLHLLHPNSSGESAKVKFPGVSSKKLLDTGFVFKYGLAEMYDDAIHCCKQRGLM